MSKQVLVCGDPGSGKTTSLLTALLRENVPTFVADFDGDVETYLGSEFYQGLDPATQALLTYEPLIDRVQLTTKKITISKSRNEDAPSKTVMGTKITPTGWQRWMELKERFFDEPPGSALVVDSGTNFTDAVVTYYHWLNGMSLTETAMNDYQPMYAMERVAYKELQSYPCMVFVISHLQHLPLGNYATDKDEVTGTIKRKKVDEAMSMTSTRWPSFLGRKSSREKSLLKLFSHAVKVEISGNKRILRSLPDDDTTFLHSNTRCDRKEAVEGLRLLVREMKGEG